MTDRDEILAEIRAAIEHRFGDFASVVSSISDYGGRDRVESIVITPPSGAEPVVVMLADAAYVFVGVHVRMELSLEATDAVGEVVHVLEQISTEGVYARRRFWITKSGTGPAPPGGKCVYFQPGWIGEGLD